MTWMREIVTYPHEVLWRAAKSSLRSATIHHDDIRDDHLAVLSLMAGFLAFEGFVNLVGEEIAPQVWRREREYFSSGDFRGIRGKVDYLFTLFPSTRLEKGAEPYQTFAKIKKVRDGMAHSRPQRYEEISDADFPDYRMVWEHFDTPDKVGRALDQLLNLAEIIRKAALSVLKEEYRLSHLHFRAFGGPSLSSDGQRTTEGQQDCGEQPATRPESK